MQQDTCRNATAVRGSYRDSDATRMLGVREGVGAERDVKGAERHVKEAKRDVKGAESDVKEARRDVKGAESDVKGAERDVKPEV